LTSDRQWRASQLVQNIEQGEMPDGQLGHHDMNDSMVDWSSVRKSAWRRKFRHRQLAYQQMMERRRSTQERGLLGSYL
jgi:hypothetical protein